MMTETSVKTSTPDAWTIKCTCGTVVSTGAVVWKHAAVKDGKTQAFFDNRLDAEKYVRQQKERR